MLVGTKLAVTPVGRPLAESATAALNDPTMALVMVDVPDVPWARVNDVGLADNEKSGGSGPAAVPKKMPLMTALLGLLAVLVTVDRKSTRLNSSHIQKSRMPSSA